MDDTSSAARPHRPPYGWVFLILVLATGAELLLASMSVPLGLRNSAFLGLSLFKAGMVASFYMHLKRDSRYYTYIFLVPVALLVVFILLTLAV
ncbi:MAG: cytochrome C oxidase subunit IV family protein [Anaerolineales bacterium]